MNYSRVLHDILAWRIRHISNRHFILLLSVVIGIAGGLAAVVLKTTVHFIHHAIQQLPEAAFPWVYLVLPLGGILLTMSYKVYIMHGKLGHGIPNLLYTTTKKCSLVEPDKMYSHLISGTMTVGLGGSVGLEAPIVTTGSAFGANLGKWLHLGYRHRTLLLGCGGAAAIAAIFNAPIAGVIFALEVLLLELSIPAFIPLLISAATGNLVSEIILGEDILFQVALTNPFNYQELPYYVLLGILTGFVSLYFTRVTYMAEAWITRIRSVFKRAWIGGIAMSVMVFVFPPLYGEGYAVIKSLLDQEAESLLHHNFLFQGLISNETIFLLFIAALVLIKAFASAFTISAGGNGGIFAPSLFIGGLTGFGLARLLNDSGMLPVIISTSNFILVGMAGVMSGVLHAPMTAIFLIAEITNGYMLFLPLMIVAAIAYTTIVSFEPHSLYTKQLALKGHLYSHDTDKFVLTQLNLEQMVESDFPPLADEDTLGDVVSTIAHATRNVFPVLDEKGGFRGVVHLDDIRDIMFQTQMHDRVKVKDVKQIPGVNIDLNESMQIAMQKFEDTQQAVLPVVDQGRFVGFLRKTKVFSHYRNELIRHAKEEQEILQ